MHPALTVGWKEEEEKKTNKSANVYYRITYNIAL